MSVEETRAGLGQVNAVTRMAIDDLAVPQEGHAVHEAAGREIAGAGQSIEQRVAEVLHHLEIARRALNEVDGNDQKIKSLLASLPAGEHHIATALKEAEQEVEKTKTMGVFAAVKGLRRYLGLGRDFKKLGSIVMDVPGTEPAKQMLEAAHDLNEAIQATL